MALHFVTRAATRWGASSRLLTLSFARPFCLRESPLLAATVTRSLAINNSQAPARIVAVRGAEACMSTAMGEVSSPILEAKEDAYGGVIIDHTQLPDNCDEFSTQLATSIMHWKSNDVRGVWLKLPAGQSSLVPVAVGQGFVYHHAEQDYVMLNFWLPDTPSTMPPNASHQVGVGAFVVNSEGQVLVVQERNGPLKGQGVWKMPTGLVSTGEDLHEAAPREVFEETGIEAEFKAVLTVRQSHGLAFGKSDLFFVCALRCEKGHDTLKPCETEIEAVKWMPMPEFLNIEFMRGRPLYSEILDACAAYAAGTYQGLSADKLEAGGVYKPRQDLLLHGNPPRKLHPHK